MNDIIHISKQKEQEILSLLKQDQNTFYVIINGKHVRTLPEYLKVMSEEFSFPIPNKGVDGYMDWIEDLTWIEQENIVLFIEDFSHFLEEDPSRKTQMIELFRDKILPWWDGEVERYVVEGEKRSFQVYLVDADDATETGRRQPERKAAIEKERTGHVSSIDRAPAENKKPGQSICRKVFDFFAKLFLRCL